MKVIVLDIDGVLNSDAFLNRDRVSDKDGDWVQWWLDYFDPAAVAVLNRLTGESGAVIVLSSTRRNWAGLEDLRMILGRAGVAAELLDKTPYLRGRPRGEEVQAWLDGNKVESYVILDDHDDMGYLADRLVQTDSAVGLTDADAERALRLLAPGGPCPPRQGPRPPGR